jgi:hypothetical protein
MKRLPSMASLVTGSVSYDYLWLCSSWYISVRKGKRFQDFSQEDKSATITVRMGLKLFSKKMNYGERIYCDVPS